MKALVALSIFVLYLAFSLIEDPVVLVEAADGGSPVHNLSTGLNYTTIQSALDAGETKSGNVVFVDSGVYYEHVVVSKPVILLGEDRENTIIDGNQTGTVVSLNADNITINGFTVRKGGRNASWLESCIYGGSRKNIIIENNTLVNATFGVLFYHFANSTISGNYVQDCGLVGLHLDGQSTNCSVTGNEVSYSLEGIDVEASSGNNVTGNHLVLNSASVVLNSCNGSNVLRNNTLNGDLYNLIVWGPSIESFAQDVDTSNLADGRKIYYITNAGNVTLNSSSCPEAGFVALVNCTNARAENFDLSHNRDGLLVAQCTQCKFCNLTLKGNRGPLVYGGLTLFKSDGNVIENSRISSNSFGLCFYQSNGNLVFHNSFVNNDKDIVSDWGSPLRPRAVRCHPTCGTAASKATTGANTPVQTSIRTG